MEEKIISEGKCLFCGKMFKKAGMTKHLSTELQGKIESGKSGKSFHVRIDPNARYYGTNGFFLNLWIDGDAKMEDVDGFLRAIWLECCGHMSSFRNPKNAPKRGGMFDLMDAYDYLEKGNVKKYEQMMEESRGEVPMSRKAKDALYKDLKLEYEYDFGSSTYLTLIVIEEYPVKASEKIVLLSRNEPLHLYCTMCKKEPATVLCSIDGDSFCEKCGEKHAKTCEDFADYAAMPIVNSPRMGVCGYDGGAIDVERDGVFKAEKK